MNSKGRQFDDFVHFMQVSTPALSMLHLEACVLVERSSAETCLETFARTAGQTDGGSVARRARARLGGRGFRGAVGDREGTTPRT